MSGFGASRRFATLLAADKQRIIPIRYVNAKPSPKASNSVRPLNARGQAPPLTLPIACVY